MTNMSDFSKKEEDTQWSGTGTSSSPATESLQQDGSESSATKKDGTADGNKPNKSATTSTEDEILSRLMSQIGDIGSDTYFKVLVYGEPGCTKSSFTATAPNNLIIDTEDGLVAAKQSPHGIAEGTKQLPFESWDQVKALMDKMDKGELPNFSTLSIDTLSELHKRALAEVTEREWRKRPSMNRYVAETEHHTENNERFLRLLRALRDLDRDLIITSHSRTVEPKNKPAKTYPDFSESLSNKICAFMDVVMYMEMREVDKKIVPVGRVISNGTVNAKNRIGLPEEIVNPTYPMLKAAWEKTRN